MQGLVVTSKGMEDITANEIKELIGADTKIADCSIVFDIKNLSELCLIAYKSQSIDRVLFLLSELKVNGQLLANTISILKESNLSDWLNKKKYVIRCIRIGEHNFSSADVEAELGKSLFSYFKNTYNCDVDFNNPDVILLVYVINDAAYIGVDFSGFELNKRHYKIFAYPSSLRATIGYALLRLGDFKDNEVLLDPFVGDGVIVIEAALYVFQFPVNHYQKDKFIFRKFELLKNTDFDRFLSKFDKKIETKSEIYGYDFLFKYVDYSRKNAKIAGVTDMINFSRVELEWLDVKFKGKSVDKIVTKLPTIKNKKFEKIVNEFFYQSSYILKDNGAISLATFSKEPVVEYAKKNNFSLVGERQIFSGKQPIFALLFKKSSYISI